jgi:hypothetical protein
MTSRESPGTAVFVHVESREMPDMALQGKDPEA